MSVGSEKGLVVHALSVKMSKAFVQNLPAGPIYRETFVVVLLLLFVSVVNCGFFDPVNPSSVVDTKAKVSEDAFRAVISAAYRVQTKKGWCYGKSQLDAANGRRYQPSDFGSYVVTLMDLLIGMNMLRETETCSQGHINFRNEVAAQLLKATIDTMPSDKWWEDTFLPMAARVFTCGAVIPSTLCSEVLPSDVSKTTCEGNLLVRQTWFLLKSYLTSPLKQRERSAVDAPPRRTDYDLSMYVPFIGKQLAVGDGTSPYQSNSELRVGFPFYVGPSLWRTFHTMAMRMVDYSSCTESQAELVKAFKRMLLYFAVAGQPCPYCREHFLSSVSRNDIQYETVCDRLCTIQGNLKFKVETPQCSRKAASSEPKLKSEANIYPIEWVIVGYKGSDHLCQTNVTDIIKSKFDGITNVTALNLFLWKLHNAVTATVRDGKYCSIEEKYDQDLFNCTSHNFDEPGRPLSRRFWPFSKRYEFSLQAGSSSSTRWTEVRNNPSIRSAVNNLMSATGTIVKLRGAVTSSETGNSNDIKDISQLVADLDAAVWKSEILQKVYSTAKLPAKRTCANLKTHLARQSAIPLPDFIKIDTIKSFTMCSSGHQSTSKVAIVLTMATFLCLFFISFS